MSEDWNSFSLPVNDDFYNDDVVRPLAPRKLLERRATVTSDMQTLINNMNAMSRAIQEPSDFKDGPDSSTEVDTGNSFIRMYLKRSK